MAWKKGQSGNPNGRPVRVVEFVEMVREKGAPQAFKTLVAASKKGNVFAATALLAYAWGRPANGAMDLSQVTDEELAAEIRRRCGQTGEAARPDGPALDA